MNIKILRFAHARGGHKAARLLVASLVTAVKKPKKKGELQE
jgi:hypothetical protein